MTELSSDLVLAAFVDDVTTNFEHRTPFTGHSRDYLILAAALRGRILARERAGQSHDSELDLLTKIEVMIEKAESHERGRALLDTLTNPRRREQQLIDEGLCLQCAGMGVDYVSVGGLGGRTCVSCSGCGGSGKYRDYKKRLGQA